MIDSFVKEDSFMQKEILYYLSKSYISGLSILGGDCISNVKKDDTLLDRVEEISAKSDINIVLKNSLTDREQLVFEYFLNNIGKTVYAKDLAELLELPRDYVYKYIKNLRAKIEGDKLKNVPSGGFILTE